MISFSNPQRQQAKVRLGNPATATVADLDVLLQGVRSGNYLYHKQHKDGNQTASSKHYDPGFNNKPPKTGRLAFRDMVIAMAQAHVNDQDTAVVANAQALLDFCIQNGVQNGLQNLKPLRAAVHALRVALDARAAREVDRSVGESFHSGLGTPQLPHKPSHSSGPSTRRDQAHEPDQRAASQQRAIRCPWEYDDESGALRANLTRWAYAWRNDFKADESPQRADQILLGGARNLAKYLQKEYVEGRASLLNMCLNWLAEPNGYPCEQPLSALECLIENGLLGLLPPEHSMLLIDDYVIARHAAHSNVTIPS